MDVWETDDEIVYAFDLPGIPKDTVSIEFDHGVLTVSAERERSQEVSTDRMYRSERRYGEFSRAIGLPQGVSEDQISARYDNGELEIHVKKPEVEMPHRIQIGNGKADRSATARPRSATARPRSKGRRRRNEYSVYSSREAADRPPPSSVVSERSPMASPTTLTARKNTMSANRAGDRP